MYLPAASVEFLGYAHLPTVHHVTDEPVNHSSPVSTRLRLVLAEYAADGRFLGYRSVLRGRVQLCPGPVRSLDAAYDVGVDYRQQV